MKRPKGGSADHVRGGTCTGNAGVEPDLLDSAELRVKEGLAARIASILSGWGFKQVQAARLLGVDQPSISDLVHGRLRGFSSDRLIRFLIALGMDVEIVIRPRQTGRRARVRVVAGGRRPTDAESRLMRKD